MAVKNKKFLCVCVFSNKTCINAALILQNYLQQPMIPDTFLFFRIMFEGHRKMSWNPRCFYITSCAQIPL